MTEPNESERMQLSDRRAVLSAAHLRPAEARPPSSARGVHHIALLSSDVEQTIRFYQDILEFPLTELFENRDYKGSSHFFFDIGHGNLLAFFDLPGLDLREYQERLGGLHHLAISVEPERWAELRASSTKRACRMTSRVMRRSTSATPTGRGSS